MCLTGRRACGEERAYRNRQNDLPDRSLFRIRRTSANPISIIRTRRRGIGPHMLIDVERGASGAVCGVVASLVLNATAGYGRDAADEAGAGGNRGAHAGAVCDGVAGQSRAPLSRTRASDAHRVCARSRPHHSFGRVSTPRIQNPGLRESRGRLLPHSPDAYARGRANRAHRRARARPQRGTRRGGRARARPGAYAVRPCRRESAQRADDAVRRLRS